MHRKVSQQGRSHPLPKAPTPHRAGLGTDQGRAPHPRLHAKRQGGRRLRVEAHLRDPQPLEALPPRARRCRGSALQPNGHRADLLIGPAEAPPRPSPARNETRPLNQRALPTSGLVTASGCRSRNGLRSTALAASRGLTELGGLTLATEVCDWPGPASVAGSTPGHSGGWRPRFIALSRQLGLMPRGSGSRSVGDAPSPDWWFCRHASPPRTHGGSRVQWFHTLSSVHGGVRASLPLRHPLRLNRPTCNRVVQRAKSLPTPMEAK